MTETMLHLSWLHCSDGGSWRREKSLVGSFSNLRVLHLSSAAGGGFGGQNDQIESFLSQVSGRIRAPLSGLHIHTDMAGKADCSRVEPQSTALMFFLESHATSLRGLTLPKLPASENGVYKQISALSNLSHLALAISDSSNAYSLSLENLTRLSNVDLCLPQPFPPPNGLDESFDFASSVNLASLIGASPSPNLGSLAVHVGFRPRSNGLRIVGGLPTATWRRGCCDKLFADSHMFLERLEPSSLQNLVLPSPAVLGTRAAFERVCKFTRYVISLVLSERELMACRLILD